MSSINEIIAQFNAAREARDQEERERRILEEAQLQELVAEARRQEAEKLRKEEEKKAAEEKAAAEKAAEELRRKREASEARKRQPVSVDRGEGGSKVVTEDTCWGCATRKKVCVRPK
jgi:hypothetical protein